ncbi:hypothetical protein KIN20_016783 [Parelaphostrongylus tenuis]|uniref:E3 ubiquitin-protein transferase MAEA n=1 Tax=Parelaphostrongylus tenuis TaxID=148309 RepID=A0AAD5MGY7_PARTN|nr:hypothetical protein KIN20_016783 [Parelaphostrongylus tenuis]
MVKLDRNAVLEYATFKVPYEELNMEFRRGHKNMERAGAGLKRSISNLRTILAEKDGCVSTILARDAFRDFQSKLEQLDSVKREAVRKQRQFIKNMQSRIHFLRNEDVSEAGGQRELELWQRERQHVARLISAQMLRCGYIESAKALAMEMNVTNMVDLEVFSKVQRVISSLLDKDTAPCLEWIAEHRSKLRRMNSKLEQVVRVQNAVELVRSDRVKDALLYVRKHLGASKDEWCDDAMKLMGLIALHARNEVPAYKELLSAQRWQALADLFREEVFTLYQLPRQSAFAMCLQCGLSAYKTPHCTPGGVEKCPTCQPCAFALAEGLPYAHTVNSRLICSFSGEALNEENHPMMMPDGRVYGEKAIRELQVDNIVRCPRTGNMIPVDHVLKLYVL